MEGGSEENVGLLWKFHLFLKRCFFFYRPWKWYWWLFFGPWTWLFRLLSLVVPKKKGLILFGSNEGLLYSDNSRALFQYAVDNSEILTPVWITRSSSVYQKVDSKYPGSVIMSPTIKSIFHYLRAEQVVISYSYKDMCKMPWIPSKFVNQLWHGVPLKKIGFHKPMSIDLEEGFVRWCTQVNRFFVASKYEEEMLKIGFGNENIDFVITGNPRNDVLYQYSKRKKEEGRTILYTPTYRERRGGDGGYSQVLLHPDIVEDKLHEFLEKNDANLIIRPHWITDGYEGSSDRIRCVNHLIEPDLFQLFNNSDVLITDYSSAFVDWLILDRPVIFAPYDLDEYGENTGFIGKYVDLVINPICKSPDKIFEGLSRALNNPDLYSIEREEKRRFYLGELGGGACARVTSMLELGVLKS